jgi:Sulfatase
MFTDHLVDSTDRARDAPAAVEAAGVRPAVAAALGWLPCAAGEIVLVHERVTHATPRKLLPVYAHELGNVLAAAAATAATVSVYLAIKRRLRPQSRATSRALDVIFLAAAALFIALRARGDSDNFAQNHAEIVHLAAQSAKHAAIAALAAGIVGALLLGRRLARPRLRWIAVAIAVVMVAANAHVLENDYFGAHAILALASAILAGSALTGAAVPATLRVPAQVTRGLLVAGGALAVWSVAVPPAPGLAMRILCTRSTPFGWLLTAWGYHGPRGTPRIEPEQAAWFAPRGDQPSIPSTVPADAADRAIVLMLTVDCFRADVLANDKTRALLPEIDKIRRESVEFSRAHSPGAQTVYTMTSWFTGKYFSELYWRKKPTQLFWPDADETTRFPALLAEHDVLSTYVMAGNWIGPSNGIVDGFTSYLDLREKARFDDYASAAEVSDRVIDELGDQGPGPVYLFAHFMDAHGPYRGLAPGGSPYRRYLSELQKVDEEIGRIRARVTELGLHDRTTLIISADHGEAFGEHGTHHHGVSVYEELIHVPLLILGPDYPARRVDADVTTLDLGPTILDLFGVSTPSSTMGESLVSVLRGGAPHFTRPIVSEDRLKQAMLFPSGKKVIRDLHLGGGEAYDLVTDPHELDNRIDDPTLDTRNEFALLDAFFRAHTLNRAGYRPPFRR